MLIRGLHLTPWTADWGQTPPGFLEVVGDINDTYFRVLFHLSVISCCCCCFFQATLSLSIAEVTSGFFLFQDISSCWFELYVCSIALTEFHFFESKLLAFLSQPAPLLPYIHLQMSWLYSKQTKFVFTVPQFENYTRHENYTTFVIQYTLTTVIGSFYLVLFSTFICQNSSEPSAIMADEVGEHLEEIRDLSHILFRVFFYHCSDGRSKFQPQPIMWFIWFYVIYFNLLVLESMMPSEQDV